MGVLETPAFSLEHTFQSHQLLKWQKLWTMDGVKHQIVVGDKLCIANQYERKQKTYTFIMGSDDDYFDIWFDVFDLKTDYTEVDRKFRRCMGPVASVEKMCKGLHKLNIPEFQVFLESFFLSNLPRSRAAYWMEQLCAACCGAKRKNVPGYGTVYWTPVPTMQQFEDNIDSEDASWYLPDNLVKKVKKAYAEWLEKKDESPMPEEDERFIMKNYHMSSKEFTEWFMDGEEDYEYLKLLLRLGRKYGAVK